MLSQIEEKRIIRVNLIRNAYKRAKNSGKNIVREMLISYCISSWGVSRRTAIEYIDSATDMTDHKAELQGLLSADDEK